MTFIYIIYFMSSTYELLIIYYIILSVYHNIQVVSFKIHYKHI